MNNSELTVSCEGRARDIYADRATRPGLLSGLFRREVAIRCQSGQNARFGDTFDHLALQRSIAML
jgi:hypothetical protein